MQYLALITSLLLGATATPIKQREVTATIINTFTATTNPEGDGAFIAYNFHIPGEIKTNCQYSDTTSDSKLPAVALTSCDDPAVRWQFRQDPSEPGTEGMYRLVIVYTPEAPDDPMSGFHEWSPDDFHVTTIGSTNETVYTGDFDFALELYS